MIVHANPDPSRGVLLSLVIGLLVALALVVFDCGNVEEVRADDSPAAVALQMCAGEDSWLALDSCAAMVQVIADKRDGVFSPALAREYSSALKTGRQPWVTELGPDCIRPPSFPGRLSWDTWEPRCKALYERAAAAVAGEVESPCTRRPDHFGDPHGDAERARSLGWVEVDCGRGHQTFWALQ